MTCALECPLEKQKVISLKDKSFILVQVHVGELSKVMRNRAVPNGFLQNLIRNN